LRRAAGVLTPLILLMLTACASTEREHNTYVIVHGAYGGGWGFHQVGTMLMADGNTVYRPTLTGQGERVHLNGPNVDLNTHIQDVVNTIEFEDLHDVVLVGHSYGGMVITGVADRIPERIKQIIYLDALLPENGESVQTIAGHNPHRPGVTPDKHGVIVPGWINQKEPLPHDEPQPGKTFTQPIVLKNQAAARAIPTTYVLYVPPGKMKWDANFYDFYERAKCRGWPTMTLTSTHNAQWTHPAALVRLLESIP
jgi:pimeloyl-ACP methyl ester carboxylesterase